jgi:hypothetical protein
MRCSSVVIADHHPVSLQGFTNLAVLAVIQGIGFVMVPDEVASAYGLATSASTLLTAQLFGGALLAWGVIVWFTRDFSGEAVRGVLIGTVIGDVVSLIIAAMAPWQAR